MLAIARNMPALISVFNQGIEIAIGNAPNTAAAPTVTTVGSASGNEFFATKRRAAIAPLAATNFYACFIDEIHRFNGSSGAARTPPAPTSSGAQRAFYVSDGLKRRGCWAAR